MHFLNYLFSHTFLLIFISVLSCAASFGTQQDKEKAQPEVSTPPPSQPAFTLPTLLRKRAPFSETVVPPPLDRTPSRDSSDDSYEQFGHAHKKRGGNKSVSEEKLLLLKKDSTKIVSGDGYNTFEGKTKGKLTKYKSLDVSEFKNTTVKYADRKSKVSVSAEDFKNPRMRQDVVLDTVDAWAKRNSANRGMFANLKNSLFHKSSPSVEKIVYKPLIFGGTYPIDCPIAGPPRNVSSEKKYPLGGPVIPKVREYGPPKTFNIDQPI